MGEMADMVLDGTLCKRCGMLVYEGNPLKAPDAEVSPGFTRLCSHCEQDDAEIPNREPCPKCGVGLRPKMRGGLECMGCGYEVPCF